MKEAPVTKLGFLVIWEFRVRAGMEAQFEHVYGPTGDWAQLFSQNEAFIKTQLVRDSKKGRRYLTLDFWKSEEAYARFREKAAVEYQAIDERCGQMTETEREIGRYVGVNAGNG